MNVTFVVEQDLTRRESGRDKDAFAELVEAFAPALFQVIRRISVDVGKTEEIIQEAFWRFWQALSIHRGDRRFFPYLGILPNKTWSSLRLILMGFLIGILFVTLGIHSALVNGTFSLTILQVGTLFFNSLRGVHFGSVCLVENAIQVDWLAARIDYFFTFSRRTDSFFDSNSYSGWHFPSVDI